MPTGLWEKWLRVSRAGNEYEIYLTKNKPRLVLTVTRQPPYNEAPKPMSMKVFEPEANKL